ncbi:MAG: biotin carboxylase N-terminal domain-containing protein [candidate division WOR-3 bacterium]
MFKKVFIADRGTRALRILRACRELNIKAVVPYSLADRHSLPVMLADEAICVGAELERDSYLNISRLLSAAEVARCDACHPGYGNLATNPEFADATRSSGINFIGASPEILRTLNNKLAVRAMLKKSGVPILPGSEEMIATVQEGVEVALKIGLPVVVKPVLENLARAYIINKEKDIETTVRMCEAEARADMERIPWTREFIESSGLVYVEKFIPDAKRIEVEVVSEDGIKVRVLDVRDITIAQGGRPLVAFSPPLGLKPALYRRIGEWACAATRTAKVTGVTNVEFVISPAGEVYFSKITPALSTFHIVTELRTGIDLVKEQFKLATGEEGRRKAEVGIGKGIGVGQTFRFASVRGGQETEDGGYSLACHIYAEDPEADFEPSYGLIADLHLPAGPWVRIDTEIISGVEITKFYDIFIGTIAVWAPEEKLAISRLCSALREARFIGIKTNQEFLIRLLERRFQSWNDRIT